jgi:antitoxin (DNA-binding transcriptional repressor) of toxin-antitoxin stability system
MRSSGSGCLPVGFGGGLDNVATCGYIGAMSEVGIRELKNRLSEYVRRVKEGEVIQVTDRGQTVAELRPPQAGGDLGARHPGLADLAQRGLLRLASEPNHPGLYPLEGPAAAPGLAARLLDEERGER